MGAEVKVVEHRRPERSAIEMRGMAGMHARIRLELEPHRDGTLVHQTFDYQLPGGPLGALAARLIFDRMAEHDIEENQGILKQVVEALAGPRDEIEKKEKERGTDSPQRAQRNPKGIFVAAKFIRNSYSYPL